MDINVDFKQARVMQPEDISAIAWIGDVDLAPDGSHVAYVVSQLSLTRDETTSAIWITDTSPPGLSRKFTAGIRRDSHPRWSPDGSMLAFLSERPCPDISGQGAEKAQLYIMHGLGGEPRRLTSMRGGVSQFSWSPSGTHIAFVARVVDETPDPPRPVVVGDRPASKPFRVIECLKYRRNGEGFIDARRHLFVVAIEGDVTARQLTDGDYDHADPCWSPGGTEIAFVSARHLSRDLDNTQSVMALKAPDLSTSTRDIPPPRTVSQIGGPCSWPSWSPDGSFLAFVGHEYAIDTGRHSRVWVVPSAGGQAQAVVDPLDRNVVSARSVRPSWSADGQSLRFTVEDDGATSLIEAPRPTALDGATGDVARTVTQSLRDVTAFSAPIGIDVVAVVSSDHVSPCEVYLVHVHRDKDAEAPLTRLNAEWASAGPFGSVHRLGVSRGDDTLSVWIYLPAGASQSDPGSVPVLLNIHGGPHAQYGDRFFDEFAVYCGAGYAVVYTNPRGSTGRTERFARAVQGDWGGIDAADVLAAVDGAVHAFPCLDATRLGIMGGSYGGYLTSWIVSHDHRFKAACSERAVNDFESFAATSDIGFWFAEGQLGASPFLEPALAAKHSPLRYAAQITTPILILHGEEDYRCPIEQAERLYVSLARRGHAVRFVRMPDADHELSRTGRPGQRVERFRQILDWFASYLLPSNKGHDD